MLSEEDFWNEVAIIRGHTLKASFIIGSISVACLLVVLLVGMIIQWYYRHESTRTSFTLALWIALWDLGFHVGNITSTSILKHDITGVSLTCTLLRYFGNMFKLLSIFTTAIVAFNLHQVFVLKKENFVSYQVYYMPVAILLTLIISIPGLVISRIQGVCWFANAMEGYKLLIAWWASGYIWMVACMIYSIAVVVSVSRVLKKHQKQMSHEVSNGSGYSKRIQRSVFRISMYPVIPVITFTFSILGSSLEFIRVGSGIESVSYGIVSISCILISDFTASATGILTAVVFCFDPMLQRFINSIRVSSISYYHSYSKTNSSTKSFKCHIIYWCLKKDIEQSLTSGEFSISYHGKSAVDEFPETHIMLSSIELMNQEGTEVQPSKHTEYNKKIQFL